MTTIRKDYSDIKHGHTIMVYEQNNISENNGGVRDTRLDLIGSKVTTEHGNGVVIGVELAPTTNYFTERYFIEITNNTGKPILKSLFPDNKLCYWKREITFN